MSRNRLVLGSLVAKDKDFVFSGDLAVRGEIKITNCSLIVSGKLESNTQITVNSGDISCQELDVRSITIKNGDIYCKSLVAADIDSNGIITVNGNASVGTVKCSKYIVKGNNRSASITTTENVAISGDNDSLSINSKNVVIDGDCNTNGHAITTKKLECGGTLINCPEIKG